MDVHIVNYTRRRLPRRQLERSAAMVARRYRRTERAVTLVFVGERRMRALNRQHRGKDKVTDVLSFFDGTDGYWGEVIVCPAQVQRQARRLNIPYAEELLFIVVHGLLHLAGLEDESAAGWRKMQAAGARLCTDIMGRAK